MKPRKLLAYALEGGFFVIIIGLVLGQVLGQPILIAFVESGSMEPTLSPSDGFVAIPAQVAGPVDESDVIVYRSGQIKNGDLTTHRVVAETEQGFITKGDANPFTDQDNGEPPVKRAQIVAVALQVGGDVVVIPKVGTAVTAVQNTLRTFQHELAALLGTRSILGVQGLAYLFFAGTILWYAIGAWRDRKPKPRQGDRSRDTGWNGHLILLALAGVLVLAATLSMTVPAGQQRFNVISAEFDSPGARIIPKGETESLTHPVPNGGLMPIVVFLEPASDGVRVQDKALLIEGRQTIETTVELSAPPETGYIRRFLVEHRYLAILPRSVIRALYEIHSWLPIAVIDAVLAGGFYGFGRLLLGSGRMRDRHRDRDASILFTIRRMIRMLY